MDNQAKLNHPMLQFSHLAHTLIANRGMRGRGESSSRGATDLVWKHLKTQPKIKMIMWKVLNDVLPMMSKLVLWKMDILPACPRCGTEHGSLCHLFLRCGEAQKIRLLSPFRIRLNKLDSFGSIIEWWSSMYGMKKHSGESKEQMLF